MNKTKIELSIITPFYNGNNVIDERLRVIEKIASENKNRLFEWIIVNDSPKEKIHDLNTNLANLIIRIFVNSSNVGIHQTRINGLNKARGEYVVFLDQDDYLKPTFVHDQLNKLHDSDLCICNGLIENRERKFKVIFKNKYQMRKLKSISTFFIYGNLIVSPGMAIIRRNSIPEVWKNSRMKINGADDWLLWVCLLAEKKDIVYCDKTLYIHKKTDNNVSDNDLNMLKSCNEALHIFEKNYCNNLKYQKMCKLYKDRLSIWYNFKITKKNKYIEYLRKPRLLFAQISYRLLGLIREKR
ncbi:glycosyltransferase family 2 protein [Thomasclavelia spiroformis]|uniref:glycosyltransferase family 2 protein n=1 Tax=Thomasclavelia spiroformis TaxID=29348 RepID=UPI0024B252B1|nr:glycosyltransferase family 2 protein [Thomasclavelia spiroformis]